MGREEGSALDSEQKGFSIFFGSSASFVFFIAISSRHVLILVTIKGGEYMIRCQFY
jgi:hypothetical protein